LNRPPVRAVLAQTLILDRFHFSCGDGSMNPTSNSLQTAECLKDIVRRYPSIDNVPLDQAALAIAASHSSPKELSKVPRFLDRLASETREMASSSETDRLLSALRVVLFEKHGFRGNDQNYYCPDNSLLDRVIETRRGIPITLSLLMMETARRLGIELVGIGLPCHFIVGYRNSQGTRYFDPFCGGVERSQIECVDHIRGLSGGSVELTASDFTPVSKRVFLTRLLNNLRCIYRHRGEMEHLTRVLENLLVLHPEEPGLHAELAIFLAEAGDPWRAHQHVQAYMQAMPDPEQGRMLIEQLSNLRAKLAVLN
jgi:regulator of sirC expression with transglutaminase-like and TPR domain